MPIGPPGGLIHVSVWHEQLQRVMPADARTGSPSTPIVRFRDIDGRIGQPALDHTVLAIHLGGPKRVLRRQGGHRLEVDVAQNSLTLMPQGEAFEWETFGSIDFAHLTVPSADMAAIVAEEFDRDVANLRLEPRVGVENRQVSDALNRLVASAAHFVGEQLYRDTVKLLASLNVLALFSRHPEADTVVRHTGTLATWQLRRVTDYMRAHLEEDIDLATLVGLTGLGRAQFFRSFKRTVGQTPFAHLRHLRLLQARKLLVDTRLSVTEIAYSVGFEPTRLSAAFRKEYMMTPSMFRVTARS